MKHEPTLVVCPATGRPLRAGAEPAKARVQPAIPAAPVPRAPAAKRISSTPSSSAGATRSRRSSAPPGEAVASGRPLSGRVIGDRYGVTTLIGEGGMGEVYEAEHLAIGRPVAVKVLHPKRAQDREAISRLRHEARVAGTLGHPNICAIYDLGRLDDGSPYLVMERLYGETLAQRLKREGTLPVGELTDIILQILSALVAAHQKGIIHRDLKPDNIFLSRRDGMAPVPKLLDFGISKAEDIEDTLVESKGNSSTAGTPYYLSPEQARGERNFDLRVDLWAVGVVLYECLTGKRPFDAKNYNALLVQILSSVPTPVDELDATLPSELARIVEKALSKDPEERFQSAKEMQYAVRLVCDAETQPQSKRQPPVREPEPQPISSKRSQPLREPEPPPVSSKQRPPVIVNEPTNDDSDSTFIFSRHDMQLARGAKREAPPPQPPAPAPPPEPPPIARPATVPRPTMAVPPAPPPAPPPPVYQERSPIVERAAIIPPPISKRVPVVLIEEVEEQEETHSGGVDEKTPIYAPFVDVEDDHTVVETPAFLNDSVTMNRSDTIPMPAPRRKD